MPELDPQLQVDPVPLRRGRGRRPTELVRSEILAAAGQLLLTEGMATFTIERVAALAGASKMTVYKLWPSKGVLALEGYASTIDAALSVPDTGDIEADLTAQLITFVQLLSDTPAGRVTAELIGASQTDPELKRALRQIYSAPRRAVGSARLAAAQERGQIRFDVDLEVLSDQLWGSCIYRLMMPDNELTAAFARTLVQNVLAGVCPVSETDPG